MGSFNWTIKHSNLALIWNVRVISSYYDWFVVWCSIL